MVLPPSEIQFSNWRNEICIIAFNLDHYFNSSCFFLFLAIPYGAIYTLGEKKIAIKGRAPLGEIATAPISHTNWEGHKMTIFWCILEYRLSSIYNQLFSYHLKLQLTPPKKPTYYMTLSEALKTHPHSHVTRLWVLGNHPAFMAVCRIPQSWDCVLCFCWKISTYFCFWFVYLFFCKKYPMVNNGFAWLQQSLRKGMVFV